MQGTYVVALDTHCGFTEVGVLTPKGRWMPRGRCPTTIPDLRGKVREVRGRREIVLDDQSATARWKEAFGISTPVELGLTLQLGTVSSIYLFPGPTNISKSFCYAATTCTNRQDDRRHKMCHFHGRPQVLPRRKNVLRKENGRNAPSVARKY